MRVDGTALLPAAPDRVLEVVRDPARFVETLPNVGELDWEAHEDASFTATIRPAIALGEVPIRTTWRPEAPGPGTLRFRVEGRTDEQIVQFDVTLALRDGDGGGTAADWAVVFEVTGTMRSAGQRTISAVVAAQAGEVLDAVGTAAAALAEADQG